MRILMFTGFLGSGKTTLALDYARFLTGRGEKVAFVINEAGEIALDSKLAREYNYSVQEVFAGCICCQVAGDFVTALQAIQDQEKPDRIIIEPSGVADPAALKNVLTRHGYSAIPIVNVADVPRFRLLAEAVPLVARGVENSSLIIINKTDLAADGKDIAAVVQAVRALNSEVPVVTAAGKNGVSEVVWQEVAEL